MSTMNQVQYLSLTSGKGSWSKQLKYFDVESNTTVSFNESQLKEGIRKYVLEENVQSISIYWHWLATSSSSSSSKTSKSKSGSSSSGCKKTGISVLHDSGSFEVNRSGTDGPYHYFVVLESDSWWWSIEKNSECIMLQRGKNKDSVVKNYNEVKRPKTREHPDFINHNVQSSMEDLIDWLIDNGELQQKYDLILNNCQHFAKRLMENFNDVETVSEPDDDGQCWTMDSGQRCFGPPNIDLRLGDLVHGGGCYDIPKLPSVFQNWKF